MNSIKAAACRTIDLATKDLLKMSNFLWNNPELSNVEYKAHAALTTFLEEIGGFTIEKQYKLQTAFKATYEKGQGPHVAIMCEFDALPGIGHACGHNLIAIAGLAAGLGVKGAMEAEGNIFGKLTILGTPAEEEGCGKGKLIKHGAFDDVDVAMMVHPSGLTGARIHNLATQSLNIKFHGKASHAAAFPWEGINALDAAVACYQSISNMRQQMKPRWRVHGIFKDGGKKPNIIPEFSELYYYIRTPKFSEMSVLADKIRGCAEGAAMSTGCTVEFELDENPYYELNINQTLASVYEENATALGIALTTDEEKLRSGRGGTDMGNVSYKVPSIHPWYDIGATFPAHTHAFAKLAATPEAHTATLNQGKTMALVALDVLARPKLLEKIKNEFECQKNSMQ